MRKSNETAPPTVLIVDADAEFHELIRIMLATHGVRVLPAYHGHDAMDWLESTKVDLIIFGMFGPAGIRRQVWDVLVQRKIPQMIPVILVANIPEEEGQDLARLLGAKGFLKKPFPKKTFLSLVGPILRLSDS
jgi:DNA-binding response OmpR family regulator